MGSCQQSKNITFRKFTERNYFVSISLGHGGIKEIIFALEILLFGVKCNVNVTWEGFVYTKSLGGTVIKGGNIEFAGL